MRKLLFVCVCLLSLNAFSYLGNQTIYHVNNEAGFDVNYSPLWMHNPAWNGTTQNVDGHQLGLGLNFTKTF